ncbi:Amidohydrolase family [Acididesulfobacillus acetoxydans]|uniref:Amidohydrolase family n=1 Tax=Acididesulfobacillus acetoxydans TaxID=1561005 RepID=A0A8S0Y4I6_9FIRM|nr:dihydropyrimidinase [Acididesulfobacillus acetoxydans]CAA7602985.1 Amidohydrolase family [Acididesulfobacillus acetoxydans]CEJ05867.1 D-hydantoinase [Acididesulfobacillus acetoxydans]
MGIVLQGGTIVTAGDVFRADLRIEGEKVSSLGLGLTRTDDTVYGVDGCYLFPGGVDPHTHFDLPAGEIFTSDDFFTGTRAALLGGTTTVLDFATQFHGESLAQALRNWQAKARGKAFTDYGFHMAVTDWSESVAEEMDLLAREDGITSFKFYMAYKNTLQVDDTVLLQAFRKTKENGSLLCLHCENGDLVFDLTREALRRGERSPRFHPLTRPVAAEKEAVSRAIALAEAVGAPLYIVHVSTRDALAEIVKAKLRGLKVYAETCPQYLLLDDSRYGAEGFEGAKYVISPPLRPAGHQEALWQGLEAKVIDTLATDHCAFNFRGQKELGREDFSRIPNGMPGVETRLGLLYTYGVKSGRMGLSDFAALTAANPAKLFGLYPRKGTLAVGSDADVVVWNPEGSTALSAGTLHQQVDYSPFEGFKIEGKAEYVFLRGRLVVQEGRLLDVRPSGGYVFRSRRSEVGTGGNKRA